MELSLFEAGMLICFGAAWPLSIYKSWKSRQTGGKSVYFLFVIFTGYLSGILHKVFFSYDPIIVLYCLNAVMVFTDIVLYFRNRIIETRDREAVPVSE